MLFETVLLPERAAGVCVGIAWPFAYVDAVGMFPVEPCVRAILVASAKLLPGVGLAAVFLALGDILEKRVDFIAPTFVKPN